MKFLFRILVLALAIFLGFFAGYVIYTEKVHYHANFTVAIDGVKYDFSPDKYMEEIAGCYKTNVDRPQDRVHLHEKNGDTIHVHAGGVAWGHLFANIGWTVGSGVVWTDNGKVYGIGDGYKVRAVVNGEVLPIEKAINMGIASEDRFLLDISRDSDEVVKGRMKIVKTDATEFNQKDDPATCSGTGDAGILEKMKSFVMVVRDKVMLYTEGEHGH